MATLDRKYDFVFLFDVQDGNPNGDPDAGNLPRVDPETGHGITTDVCLKRKLRNYVLLSRAGQPGFDIFVKERAILNNLIGDAYSRLGIDLSRPPVDPRDGKQRRKAGEAQGAERNQGAAEMCRTFFDIRAFGAVLNTGPNAGQVRGPVQLTFSRSVDPIVSLEHSITRVAITKPEDAESKSTEMGRKSTIPYGLYVCHGFVSASLARQTGFSAEDLGVLWEGFERMFEHDRSAARGLMSARGLVVFEHESHLGNAPAHALFERVRATRKDASRPARSFADYSVIVDAEGLPQGVSLSQKIS